MKQHTPALRNKYSHVTQQVHDDNEALRQRLKELEHENARLRLELVNLKWGVK